MNFENVVPGRKVSPLITPGVSELELDGQVLAVMVVFALKEWKRSNGDSYFHTYETKKNGSVEVTNGNKPVLTYSKGKMKGITKKVYTIVDDYGADSEEGLVVTLLLPEEY